jgi:hypothetical protein
MPEFYSGLWRAEGNDDTHTHTHTHKPNSSFNCLLSLSKKMIEKH